MKMRAKIRSVIALLLSVVVVMSSLLPGVSAAAPVATPTDAEQSGTVVFVPESETHSSYKPEAMGAYGVVYEIYDSDDRKAGEFALSYDGKAYVDADGEDYVYSQEEKSLAKKEKVLELTEGKYTLKQSDKLYRSQDTVADAGSVERDKKEYSFKVDAGSEVKLKVVIRNKTQASPLAAATATDALQAIADIAATDSEYWVDGDWCNQSYNDYGNYHIGTTANVPNKYSSGADKNRVFCVWHSAIGPCGRNNAGKPVPYAKSSRKVTASMKRVIVYYYEVLAKKADYSSNAGKYLRETQLYLSYLAGYDGEVPSWASAAMKHMTVPVGESNISIDNENPTAKVYASYRFFDSSHKVQATETGVIVSDPVKVTVGAAQQRVNFKVPANCKLYLYRSGKWIIYTADGNEHELMNGDRFRLVTDISNGGKSSTLKGTGKYAIWETSYYVPKSLPLGGNQFQPVVKAESSTRSISVKVSWPRVSGRFSMLKLMMKNDGSTVHKAGAVYTMYNSKNEVLAKFKTRERGYALITKMDKKKCKTLSMLTSAGAATSKKGTILTGIPIGTYTIKETTVPDDCEAEGTGRYAVLRVTATGQTLTYSKAEKQKNGTVKWTRVTDTSTTWETAYTATDTQSGDPLALIIQKVDAESGTYKEAGAASLERAVFKLEYYRGKKQDKAVGTPDNTWYIRTRYVNGKYRAYFGNNYIVNTDEYPSDVLPSNVNSNGIFLLEPGSVRITEVKPSTGYMNITDDNAGYIRISAGGKITYIDDLASTTVYLDGSGNTTYFNNVLDKNTIQIYEPVKRGDIEFDKTYIKSDGTAAPMAGVVFRITSKTTGESHYVVTDADGHFSSRTLKNTNNTNANCSEYTETEDGYTEGDMDSTYGVWFCGDADVSCEDIDPDTVSDDRGAFPYDTYIIEEMRCKANEGYTLAELKEVTVADNKEVVSVDAPFVNVPYPRITTLSEHSVRRAEKVTLKDELHTYWLKADTCYTAKGIVFDKESGKPAVDGAGQLITGSKVFTTTSEGAVNGYLPEYNLTGDDAVEFTFNSIGMDSSYVIFEYLYEGSDEADLKLTDDGQVDTTGAMTDAAGNLVCHADIKNEDGSQTFTVPWIETDAFADENGMQEIQATEKTKISDTVICRNLVKGEKYRLVTKAAFKKNGNIENVKDGSKELMGTTEFTAEKTETTKTVKLPEFDATPYEGCTITVYQWLYMVSDGEDILAAEHTDYDNVRQQINFVKLRTKAKDPDTEDNFTSSVDKVKERVDNVICTNLTIGHEYTLTPYLMDRATGDRIKDSKGNYVTGNKTFTATKKNMTVPVIVKYNPVDCGLVGKKITFFEYMTTLGKDVACHTDLNDEGQGMGHPKLHTVLHESGSAVKEIKTSGIVNLTDTADYVELKKGYEFEFVAKFINADTGKVISIDGNDAVVRKPVKADADNGTIHMDYSFDIQKSGLIKADGTVSDVVCYEYVYYKGELLFAEEDITNRDQTVSIKPISGRLTVHKRELQNKTIPISGVTFMLFKKAATVIPTADTEKLDGLTDAQLREIASWKNKTDDMYMGTYVTDKNGDIVVDDLTAGDYYVVETKTLDTYKLCTERPEFTIDGKNDVEITITNEAKVGYVTITGPEDTPSQGGWPGRTPNTGDSTPIAWLLLFFAIALAGAAAVLAVKKKKHSNMLILMLIAGAALFMNQTSVLAAESDPDGDYITETSTEVYYTDDETAYNFGFEESKEDDKNTYTLDRVEYDTKRVNSDEKKAEESVSKTEENVAAGYKAPESIKQNGYTYILSKSEVIKQSKPMHIEAYKDTEYVSSEPVPDQTMQYTYVDADGKEHELDLPYTRTEILDTVGSTEIVYNGVVSGLNYKYIQIGDKLILSEDFSLDEATMKNILIDKGYDVSEIGSLSFSLSPDTYTDSKGNLCRNYTISVGRTGTKYRIYYTDDVDDLDVTYKAVDVYVLSDADKDEIDKYNNETLVTATAYYKAAVKAAPADEEKTMSPVKKAVLAGSIILGVLVLIALALYLVKGGRRDTDRKSKRDIKRDYKEL